MNFTAFSVQLQELSALVTEAEHPAEPCLQLGHLLQSIGMRSAALREFRLADADNAPAKLVGTPIAMLEYELGHIDTAIEYLSAKTREPSQRFKSSPLPWLMQLAAASDTLAERADMTPDDALHHLNVHLQARRFDRLAALIEKFNLDAGSPRARSLKTIAALELKQQAGKLTWKDALELALAYDHIRDTVRASATLAGIDSALLGNEAALDRVGHRLIGLGNPIAAARHAAFFLQHNPESYVARRILVQCGSLMDDPECIAAGSSDIWHTELAAAQNYATLLIAGTGERIDPDSPETKQVLTSTNRLLLSLASALPEGSRKSELLRAAAYLTSNDDAGILLGLPPDRIRQLNQFVESRHFPTEEAARRITAKVGPVRMRSLTDIDKPFRATSLLETAARTDHITHDPQTAQDGIALISPSVGMFQPKVPDAIVGVPGDGWKLPDFSQAFQTVPIYLAKLSSARLIGRGFLVNSAGEAIIDAQNDGIRRCYLQGILAKTKAGWLRKARTTVGPDNASLIYNSPLTGRLSIVETPCYLLDNGQGYNFANWHMYVYPRLYAYYEAGLDRQGVKLVVYQNTSPRLLDILKSYGITENDLHFHDQNEISLFTDLYVPSAMSDVERLLAPQAFRTYDRASIDHLLSAGLESRSLWEDRPVPRKVYLSRSDVARRRLLNEDRIEAIASDLGYEVLLPAALSVIDVLRLFRDVDVICGPSGSSFLNMLYMKPGAHAIMISHPLYSPTAYLCCQFGGLRDIGNSLVFGRVEGGERVVGEQEPFSVDEQAVADLMSRH